MTGHATSSDYHNKCRAEHSYVVVSTIPTALLLLLFLLLWVWQSQPSSFSTFLLRTDTEWYWSSHVTLSRKANEHTSQNVKLFGWKLCMNESCLQLSIATKKRLQKNNGISSVTVNYVFFLLQYLRGSAAFFSFLLTWINFNKIT